MPRGWTPSSWSARECSSQQGSGAGGKRDAVALEARAVVRAEDDLGGLVGGDRRPPGGEVARQRERSPAHSQPRHRRVAVDGVDVAAAGHLAARAQQALVECAQRRVALAGELGAHERLLGLRIGDLLGGEVGESRELAPPALARTGSVLHRPPRRGGRRRHARGPAARVLGLRRLLRRGGPRSAGRGDVHALQAHPRGRRGAERTLQAPAARAPRDALRPRRRRRPLRPVGAVVASAPGSVHAGVQLRRRGGDGPRRRGLRGRPLHARRRAPRARRRRASRPRRSPAAMSTPEPTTTTASTREAWPGRPFPLGATWDGQGTNFAIFSENAQRVRLCLFDDAEVEEQIELPERTAHVWHGYLPGVAPGQRYGFRVDGPYDPSNGHRFNPSKLLIDPYAKSIEDGIRWDAANVLPYTPDGTEDADLEPDDEDDAEAIPKSIVVDADFWWEGDTPPRTPWNETVIYETHVKGYTMRHPAVREDLRGTYAGLASEEALGYLKRLGVTAVELLPIHHIADESFLHERGLSNYWGYSSIGYLAPHAGYAATGRRGEQVREFKGMVKALHRAGIEVILDVVYNHTAEGNHLGPMLA